MECGIFHSRWPEKDNYYIERYFEMIKIEGSTLRQLQMVELEMLIEFDRICRKCGMLHNKTTNKRLNRQNGFILCSFPPRGKLKRLRVCKPVTPHALRHFP